MSPCPARSLNMLATLAACRYVSWFVSWIENENQPVGGTRIETEIQPLHTISRAGAFPHIPEVLENDFLNVDHLRHRTTSHNRLLQPFLLQGSTRRTKPCKAIADRVSDPLVPNLVRHRCDGLEAA